MKFTGRLKEPIIDYLTGRLTILFEPCEDFRQTYEELKDCEKLSLEIKRYRRKRSLDANGLLWHCLDEIAKHIHTDKWSVYLKMLRRYGVFTYIVVKKSAVEKMMEQWRECEIVGEIDINGESAVQLLCYFGSSTYDTSEFSRLLDGVISEMKEMGIQTPTSKEMRRSLDEWEKLKNGKTSTDIQDTK